MVSVFFSSQEEEQEPCEQNWQRKTLAHDQKNPWAGTNGSNK